MANIPETLLRNRLFIAVLILFTVGVAGCISQPPEVLKVNPEIDRTTPAGFYNVSQQPEVLKVNPEIDWNTPVGFYNKSDGTFTLIKGSIPEVKESLREPPQQSTFSVNDSLNIIVFRGVFSKAGYGINIDRVERQGNAFTVYATYVDWEADIQVETHPTAIIPIGKLGAGDYQARLKMTKVLDEYIEEGKAIERKVIETEKELSAFNFKVRSSEENVYYYTEYQINYTGRGEFDQKQASIVWNKINNFDEAKFVSSEKSYSAVIFMQPYTVGSFNPSTAEWIVVISSIPEKTEEIKIAIFRLDYQTFDVKKSYTFSYPTRKELSLEESIAIMEEDIKKDPYGDRPVEKEKIKLQGGNYIYSYPPGDFGGTIIVNIYAGRAIFFATTVWAGRGKLIIPEDGEMGITPIKQAPVESEMEAETPAPTPTAQANPQVPGFGMVLGVIGVLVVWWRLKK